ncbi:MAG: FHA domain-containing protein [Aggregatilineales bacterium]
MSDDGDLLLAKVTWADPTSGVIQEHILAEGATATIGRSSSNDICIPEHHVSRQHAVINYRDGIFMITDLGSANGTFINDEKIDEPFPLFSGDQIRLFVPLLSFSAAVSDEDRQRAQESGTLITKSIHTGKGKLIITSGQQEGQVIPLIIEEVSIGRATSNATWEIGLQDASVSRPHAKLVRNDDTWMVHDMGSSNGTRVNNTLITEQGRALRDGDIITIGTTLILYRAG